MTRRKKVDADFNVPLRIEQQGGIMGAVRRAIGQRSRGMERHPVGRRVFENLVDAIGRDNHVVTR